MKNESTISIILPAHNEQKDIKTMYQKIVDEWKKIKYELEIIFINDGSSDSTLQEIESLHKKDNRVKGISFSRNFGHQAAIEAGLKKSTGAAVIMLDCDGQHPPHLFPELIKEWENGAKIVNTIRKATEGESFLKKLTSNLFYGFINKFSDARIIPGSADFRLLDRAVIDVLNQLPEQPKFYRGLVNWVGFSVKYVEYKAQNRLNGQSSYTFKKMYKFATDGFTGFSNFPLKISKYIGLMIFSIGIVGLISMLLISILSNIQFPIWIYILVVLLLLNGMQFIVLWFIGNYVGRIFNQQRLRPTFIIEDDI